jgi:hypothetical protein
MGFLLFLSQLFASAIGGFIAGYFVVVGVRLQFRRQSEAALRALMVEVTKNKEVALEMNRSRTPSGEFQMGNPDPGWLKHSIWDSQLAYVVQLFDAGTLAMVRHAYTLLESVPAMVNERHERGDPRFSHGGWIDAELEKIQTAFSDADQALENLKKRLDREAYGVWHRRLQKFVSDLCLRFRTK